MFQLIPRNVILALCLAGGATASHAGVKCKAVSKLFHGQVTTSEPLSEGDVTAVVNCQARGGFATLPSETGWFQVEMAEEACLTSVSVLPRISVVSLTQLLVEFLAADGSLLGVNFGTIYFAENAVWHRMTSPQRVCGVKSVRVSTLLSQQHLPVSFLEIKAN